MTRTPLPRTSLARARAARIGGRGGADASGENRSKVAVRRATDAARRACVLTALVASNPAFAAADAFLCTPNGEWVGESADTQYRNCVQFDWIAFGAALEPPPEAGIPGSPSSMLGPLVFQSRLDSLTPTLVTQVATGATFDVDLYVRAAGSSNWKFKVSYSGAVVGDLALAGTSEVPTATVTLRARTITYTARTLDTGGNVTGTQTVTWTAP